MTNDPWLKTSIMAKRGVARGEAGRRHELSIVAQGAFHYVYGPYVKPVLTVEPGCYIPAGEGVPAHYANIGVRIEDDVAVTATGHEVLTAAAPKTVAAIEALMRG